MFENSKLTSFELCAMFFVPVLQDSNVHVEMQSSQGYIINDVPQHCFDSIWTKMCNEM